MKKTIYFICYVVGLIIGALLLVFNYEAMNRDQEVLRYTMMATGIVFIIPGIIQLIASLVPRKDEFGNIMPRKWYATVVAIMALLWGIYILIFPIGYNNTLSITLGVSLMLAGLAQMVWIVKTAETTLLRFVAPVITVAVGVLVCLFFNKGDGGKSEQIATVISGIMMLIWAVNGFFSLRSKRVVAAADKAAKVERKAEKEERKSAKAAARQEAANEKADIMEKKEELQAEEKEAKKKIEAAAETKKAETAEADKKPADDKKDVAETAEK